MDYSRNEMAMRVSCSSVALAFFLYFVKDQEVSLLFWSSESKVITKQLFEIPVLYAP